MTKQYRYLQWPVFDALALTAHDIGQSQAGIDYALDLVLKKMTRRTVLPVVIVRHNMQPCIRLPVSANQSLRIAEEF